MKIPIKAQIPYGGPDTKSVLTKYVAKTGEFSLNECLVKNQMEAIIPPTNSKLFKREDYQIKAWYKL